MRNPPLPLDQCYPLGIPEDVKKEMGDVELDIDCIPSRDGKGARIGKRLVDSANKTYYQSSEQKQSANSYNVHTCYALYASQ